MPFNSSTLMWKLGSRTTIGVSGDSGSGSRVSAAAGTARYAHAGAVVIRSRLTDVEWNVETPSHVPEHIRRER